MIEAGLGSGILAEGAAQPFVAAKQLRLVRLSDPWAKRHMYICVRDYESLPAIARRLVDHLQRTKNSVQS